MNWQFTPYSIPMLVAAIMCGGLAFYAWKRRPAPGATTFALLMLTIAEWSLAYVLELSSTSLETKTFWAQVQYLGIAFLPLAWLAFALEYTNREKWLTRRNLALLSIMPALTVLLMWTNEAHMLIWINPKLDASGPFPAINKGYGNWFWVHSAYSYILLLLGTIFLIRMLFRSTHLYRQQAIFLLIGVLIPWVSNGLSIAGLKPIPNLDLTPFTFALSGVVMGWALFRYQLLDIMPVARRAVVDGISDGVIVLNAQNRIVDLNQAAQHIIGYNATEAIGKQGAEVFAGRPDLIERYRDTTEAQTEIVLGEDKNQYYFDLRISPLYDQRDRLAGRLIVLRDITKRKRAEEELQQQHAFLRQVIDINPHFIFAKDRHMRYTLANRAFAKVYRTTVEELIGKTDADLNPNQDMVERYDRQDMDVIETGQELIQPEAQVVDVVGQTQWRHIIKRPIVDKNGETQQVLGVVTDITERKRAEEDLRESEERLRQVFSSISDHIYMTEFTRDGQWINHYMSPTKALTGYPVETMLADWNFWPSKMIHPDDRALAAAQAEQLSRGQNSEIEYRLIRANGSVIWVRDSGRIEKNSLTGSVMVYGVVSNISERKQAEEALAQAHNQALEASRLKSQLLANVSHDLRSPLGSILGYTEMLQAGVFDPLTEKQQEATENIIESADQLLDFINNLLGQAQIESGKVVLNIKPFDPAELFSSIKSTSTAMARTKGLEMVSEIGQNMPATLSGDLYWLRQILVNLVSNAIKFTEQGKVRAYIYRADDTHWALQVSDTGCGIPSEAQVYIFDAFRQVDGTATRKQHTGSGLGLSIVKQLTTLMGGQITLTSQEGQGSTFTVLLPLNPE